ncbi:hypothetical protein LCGC14_0895360 [marine sediment metagenome]|uniref:Uncharacterized protein n=1 Tax=marine sediment metagenome TaxID=412755 RepID=A0A0F9P2V0_9ZZZZ
MARNYFLALKIINAAVFAWLFYTFLISIFDFNAVITTADNKYVIFAFFGAIRNVFSYLIYGGGLLIAYFVAFATAGIYSNYMFEFIETFFERFLSSWFSIGTPSLGEIPNLMLDEVGVLFNDLYLFAFQLLILISVIYAIRAFFNSDPKNHLIALGSLIFMTVLPLMITGLYDMLDLFNVHFPILTDMADPLNNPLKDSLFVIPVNNFFQFIMSPVIVFAIVSYIYLELAFQVNYTDTVTKPSLQRRDRLEAQLEILERESHYVTANVDKIKEEAKKRMEEIELAQQEGITIGKFFAKTGKRFSYVKEMIEKKKLEEEEKKLVTAASKTRRLGRYVDRLFREDSEARDTLTASSSAPRAGNLATSTIVNFTYRVGLLLVLSFIIIHPLWFLDTIIRLPDAITESVAMYSPEVIIILLLPIMLIFPVISQLISFVKHRNLIVKLQQEGRIKELLISVGDYVKTEEFKEETKVEGESSTVAADAT